ncbi:MAG: hypothetical protein WA081_18745 [Desulfosalsimonadaceae bacterium]
MKKARILIAFSITLVILCFSNIPVFAQSSGGDDVARRIDFIQERLDAGKTDAKRWQYSWMFIHGFSTDLQFGLAATQTDNDEEEDRYDNVVGGISSLLAVGDLTFNPLVAWNAADKLRALPDKTSEEKKAKLRYAEQLLKDCADREESGRSWKTHALSGLVSLIGGAAIAMDEDEDNDHRYDDGAAFLISSMLVAEIQIFTMPTRAMADWKDYSAITGDKFETGMNPSPPNRFFISANPKGIFCTILF